MSKYDNLDASTELEQAVTADLKNALEKRGCIVTHHGGITHAAGGRPDITTETSKVVITVEVTKLKGAAQDRELNAIRDHLNVVKARHSKKKCYCIYSAPTTPQRMRDGIRDHNEQRRAEGNTDLIILPLNFENLELLLTRWDESDATLYPFDVFLKVFSHAAEFIDDLRVLKLVVRILFPQDAGLLSQIESQEREADTKTLESLIKVLTNLENTMRQNGIATAGNAIQNLIFLVFLKVHEEKRERKGQVNRLRTKKTFEAYCSVLSETVQQQKMGIHELFNSVKQTPEF